MAGPSDMTLEGIVLEIEFPRYSNVATTILPVGVKKVPGNRHCIYTQHGIPVFKADIKIYIVYFILHYTIDDPQGRI